MASVSLRTRRHLREDEVSDITFMPPEERAARYAEVKKQHAKAVRQERRFDTAKTVAIIGLGGLCGLLGWSNWHLAEKALNTNVVYAVIRDDGTVMNSVRFTSLPVMDQRNTAINSLWDYVQSRECFNQTTAERAWVVVQAMSDVRVAREFREWFGQENKDSPQHVYGDHNIRIDCAFVGYSPLGHSGDRYEFTFDRREVSRQSSGPWVRYKASVRFRTGIFSPDPQRAWVEKSTFNAAGVQVIEYPNSRAVPEGVASLETK